MAWAIRKTLNRLQAADAEVTQARQDVEQKYARKDPETGAYLPCCEVPYDFDRWAGLWRD